MTIKYKGFLSGNALKIIAAVFMAIDHIGVQFGQIFPEWLYLTMRAIGRISMPMFAYFIAEGCRYTKDKLKYFLTMFCLGAVCDAVYYVALGQLYFCILTTFSLSVLLIYAYEGIISSLKNKTGREFMYMTAFLAILLTSYVLDVVLEKHGGILDYGVAGVILPFLVYLFKNRWLKLACLALGILFACLNPIYAEYAFPVQWFGFTAVLLMALYNGGRGKRKMKYFFYFFYPLHLVAIYGIYLAYMLA